MWDGVGVVGRGRLMRCNLEPGSDWGTRANEHTRHHAAIPVGCSTPPKTCTHSAWIPGRVCWLANGREKEGKKACDRHRRCS